MSGMDYIRTLEDASAMLEANDGDIGATAKAIAPGNPAAQNALRKTFREMQARMRGYAGQDRSQARKTLSTVNTILSCSWKKTGNAAAGLSTGAIFTGAGLSGALPLVTFSTSAAGDSYNSWPQANLAAQLYDSNIILEPSRGRVVRPIVISGLSYALEVYGPTFDAIPPAEFLEQLRLFAQNSRIVWYIDQKQPGVPIYLHEMPSPRVPQRDLALTGTAPAPVLAASPFRNGAGGDSYLRLANPITIAPEMDVIAVLANVPAFPAAGPAVGSLAHYVNQVFVPGDFFRFTLYLHGAGIEKT